MWETLATTSLLGLFVPEVLLPVFANKFGKLLVTKKLQLKTSEYAKTSAFMQPSDICLIKIVQFMGLLWKVVLRNFQYKLWTSLPFTLQKFIWSKTVSSKVSAWGIRGSHERFFLFNVCMFIVILEVLFYDKPHTNITKYLPLRVLIYWPNE